MNPTYDPGRFGTPEDPEFVALLWEFLNTEASVSAMITASDLGHPAVVGIAVSLLHQFGDVMLIDRNRQLCGHMVKQVMQHHGYEIDLHDVKVTTMPFTKAARYRRSGTFTIYAFRASKDHTALCLAKHRRVAEFPAAPDGGKWTFWTTITTPIQAAIGFDIMDTAALLKEIETHGYKLHTRRRMTRAG